MKKKVLFSADVVQQLAAQLQVAGPEAVLFVEGQGTGTTLQVSIPRSSLRAPVRFQPLNNAHICPGPLCPE